MEDNSLIAKINYILEKLTEEQFAPYKKLYENMKEQYDERYSDIFGVGQNRLYLDDNINISAEDYSKANMDAPIKAIQKIFNKILYGKYYFKNISSDILNNRIFGDGDDNREYRLTKLLKLIADYKIKGITDEQYYDTEEKFDEYKSKFGIDLIDDYISKLPPKKLLSGDGIKLMVVISKDPYDIAGMSTDRRWKSCMRLPSETDPRGGGYHEHIEFDVKLGSLVAYLISPEDKNIDKPYARIAIKPYRNRKKKTVKLFAEEMVYHDDSLPKNVYDSFSEIVNAFLKKVQPENAGLFEIPDALYNDSGGTVKFSGTADDLLEIYDVKKIFNCETGSKEFPGAIVIPKIEDYDYFELFDKLNFYLGRLNQTDDVRTAYNRVWFKPSFDNYINKVAWLINDEKPIALKDLPKFFETLYAEGYISEVVKDRVKMVLSISDKIVNYDIKNVSTMVDVYSLLLVYNGTDKNKNILEPTTEMAKGGPLHTNIGENKGQYDYEDLFTMYIYDHNLDANQYVARVHIDVNIEVPRYKNISKLYLEDIISLNNYLYINKEIDAQSKKIKDKLDINPVYIFLEETLDMFIKILRVPYKPEGDI